MSSIIGQSVSQSETCLRCFTFENFRTQSLLRTLAIVTIPNLPYLQNMKVYLASQSGKTHISPICALRCL